MIVEITVGNFTWRAQMSLNQTKYMQAYFFCRNACDWNGIEMSISIFAQLTER